MAHPNYKVKAYKYSGAEFPLYDRSQKGEQDGTSHVKSMKEAMRVARYCMKEPSWDLIIGKVQVLRHRVEQGLHLYVLEGGAELTRRAPYGPSWDGKVTETRYPK